MIITQAGPEEIDLTSALLLANGLPLDGFPEDAAVIFCALEGTSLIGGAALEIHGAYGLMRSVVVAPGQRGSGCGSALVRAVLREAERHSLESVYLLTETAAAFFKQRGFTPLERADVPEEVRRSVEFVSACPESAQAMRFRIEPAR